MFIASPHAKTFCFRYGNRRNIAFSQAFILAFGEYVIYISLFFVKRSCAKNALIVTFKFSLILESRNYFTSKTLSERVKPFHMNKVSPITLYL